jgi:FMN phosphatase YigB (HAD superfamily)
MGIGRYFTPPSIIDSDSLKVRKPHKRIFQTALQQLHVTSKQAVMVGDSWRNDIEGALSVGLDAVWANFRMKKKPPRKLTGTAHVITITKPQELLSLFYE